MSTLTELPDYGIHFSDTVHFDHEVSRLIGETVSALIARDGDIIYGDLIHAIARTARHESCQHRRTLLLSALDRLLGDQPAHSELA
ncbi:universal stress protein [Edwardsiella tarda]|uniref:Universal stress protein n=3 Tax=Edwardsiella tarda TaxID=636 RepID=A0A2A7U425_EDWTA|nr:hypothetical protein [Edwardsiella tarda]AKH89360.1 universal stress protein [Edwardsiella tarda]ATI62993.1 universal stress protein [Edwardsiella tarda]EFE23348.1 hypothetical protein EDWATA_01632 [Edwardsiella tarda ATCC 23685]PEH72983.1 universal stress protein [Edwardsiella tarda]UAL54964.1 universal stress protein [Edwardsiella tarda]